MKEIKFYCEICGENFENHKIYAGYVEPRECKKVFGYDVCQKCYSDAYSIFRNLVLSKRNTKENDAE